MQVGHKKAASKGGVATLGNTVCLCLSCNKLMGTDSWETFLKKMGKETEEIKTKSFLNQLRIGQLAFLAKGHGVKVKGRVEESLFESNVISPSKRKYVTQLTEKLKGTSEESIRSELN